MSQPSDPEELALLYVQQYLHDKGHFAALTALEASSGVRYDDDKPARGSELMELVYLQLEQQFAKGDNIGGSSPAGGCELLEARSHSRWCHWLSEDQLLSSFPADYPTQLVLDSSEAAQQAQAGRLLFMELLQQTVVCQEHPGCFWEINNCK
eukprot:gene6504-6731_t